MTGAIAVAALGCSPGDLEARDPLVHSFQIAFSGQAPQSDPATPLPFPSSEPFRVRLQITALDRGGQLVTAYEQAARLDVHPGRLGIGQDRIRFKAGEATVEADLLFAFGPTRIWVEDVGEDPLRDCHDGEDNDADGLIDAGDPDCLLAAFPQPEARASFATGVSPALHFAELRVRDVQFNPQCGTDTPLSGANARIRTGELIVTGTTQTGFYLTDLAGPPGGFNSIYVFTYSNPSGVGRGDRLCEVQGNVAEFIGNTQLNFPDYENADWNGNGRYDDTDRRLACELPEPVRIGPEVVPEPVILTPAMIDPEQETPDAVVPAGFYAFCGVQGAPSGPSEGTDCGAARNALSPEQRFDGPIDCRRDNFGMEPWEHALVAVEAVTIGSRFADCDLDGNGRVQFGTAEGDCANECTDDPLCTEANTFASFGQWGAGLGCSGEGDAITCQGKIYITTQDTVGIAEGGFDPREHAGEHLDRVIGHLRQTQPARGVPSIWIVEPRILEDFVSGGGP